MSINGELGVRKNYVNDSLTANAFLRAATAHYVQIMLVAAADKKTPR